MNLAGACLVMLSLTHAFNLSAFLMEAAWAGVAAYGLIRVILRRSFLRRSGGRGA